MQSARKVGTGKGSKNIAGQMAKDNVADAGMVVQEAGRDTLDGKRSVFDIDPHMMAGGDPNADERLRDRISMQPYFGQDKIMGAQNQSERRKYWLGRDLGK